MQLAGNRPCPAKRKLNPQKTRLQLAPIGGSQQTRPKFPITKSILDPAGIASFLAGANPLRMDWFYSNLVGGIKLLVRAEDAEAAARQLDEIRPEKFDVEGLGEYEQRRCPKCGSMEISLDGLNKRLTFGAMAITGMPIPAASYGWKCQERGHQWSEGETDSEEDADRQEPAR